MDEIGTLVVIILKGRNLIDKHSFYKQDVFAQAALNGKIEKTEVDVKGGQTPVWDSELRFPILRNAARILEISCYCKDPRSSDHLGTGKLDITETLKTGEFDDWVPLEMENGKDGELVQRGEVYLEMTFFSSAPPPPEPEKKKKAKVPMLMPPANEPLMRRPSKWAPNERLARPPVPSLLQPGRPAPTSHSRTSSLSPKYRNDDLPPLPEGAGLTSKVPTILRPGPKAGGSRPVSEYAPTSSGYLSNPYDRPPTEAPNPYDRPPTEAPNSYDRPPNGAPRPPQTHSRRPSDQTPFGWDASAGNGGGAPPIFPLPNINPTPTPAPAPYFQSQHQPPSQAHYPTPPQPQSYGTPPQSQSYPAPAQAPYPAPAQSPYPASVQSSYPAPIQTLYPAPSHTTYPQHHGSYPPPAQQPPYSPPAQQQTFRPPPQQSYQPPVHTLPDPHLLARYQSPLPLPPSSRRDPSPPSRQDEERRRAEEDRQRREAEDRRRRLEEEDRQRREEEERQRLEEEEEERKRKEQEERERRLREEQDRKARQERERRDAEERQRKETADRLRKEKEEKERQRIEREEAILRQRIERDRRVREQEEADMALARQLDRELNV